MPMATKPDKGVRYNVELPSITWSWKAAIQIKYVISL